LWKQRSCRHFPTQGRLRRAGVNAVRLARAAGTPLVLVSFGYTEVPAWELRPDRLIDHFDELLPACLELLAPA
jgi:hypothetical protein